MKGRTGKLGLTVSALSRHIAKLDRAPVMASTHLEHPLAQRSKIALKELSA
jgi:hypothetical protein